MDEPVTKLQVDNLASIEFAHSNVKKVSHLQMAKTFHICKWISFAISTFVIIHRRNAFCSVHFHVLQLKEITIEGM